MEFQAKWVLLLLLLLPLLAFFQIRKRGSAAVRFSSLANMRQATPSWRLRFRPLLVLLRQLGLACLIVALARPRLGTVLSEISTEGIAIEAVIDRSSSMQAEMAFEGQKLNRLEVVKRVLGDFVKGDKKKLRGRAGDLIGLVTFARYANTVCPLILSHDVLLEFMKQTQLVTVQSEDGTAIGDALALAAARLRKAEEEILRRRQQLGLSEDDSAGEAVPDAFRIKSKVIILLTDGRNNVGDYHPQAAAELAKKWGIKIYTIGIGSSQSFRTVDTILGRMKMPVRDELDEGLLKSIADVTGGFYSRADDVLSLRSIVQRINDLEKSEVTMVQYTQYSERFAHLALAALVCLLLEIMASCTLFRKIP